MRFICVKVRSRLTLAFLLFTVTVLIICLDFINAKAKTPEIITNDARVGYLQSLGYQVKPECAVTKEVVIPDEFGDVYENYNELQRMAGFDLSDYRGKNVDFYSYKITNKEYSENFYANLLICDGTVIGGDISSSEINGNMYPLWERSKNENSKT